MTWEPEKARSRLWVIRFCQCDSASIKAGNFLLSWKDFFESRSLPIIINSSISVDYSVACRAKRGILLLSPSLKLNKINKMK